MIDRDIFGAYLYEIGERVISEEFVELIAYIGKGNGKISRGYLIGGLRRVVRALVTLKRLREELDLERILKLYTSLGYGKEAEGVFSSILREKCLTIYLEIYYYCRMAVDNISARD